MAEDWFAASASQPQTDWFAANAPKQAPAAQPAEGSNTALAMRAATQAIPAAATLAGHIATSPTLPQTAGTIGRVVGAVGPALGELAAGNPSAAIAMLGQASRTSWGGGKLGFFNGRLLQSAANPVATALDRVAPYAERAGAVLAPLNIAQGGLDLAQMADPHRKDIGVLGVGSGTPDPAHPALINDYAAKIRDYVLGKLHHGR